MQHLKNNIFRQLFWYGAIGFAHTIVGYILYLFFTWLGFDPKLVVAISYPLFAIVSYFGNKNISFSYAGNYKASVIRYIMSHTLAYLLNISILYIFVDRLLYTHQYVQLGAMCVVAATLFIMFKYYVFPSGRTQDNVRC